MRHGYYYGHSKEYKNTPPEQRVLVGLLKSTHDFEIAHTQGWYRIPVRSAPKPMEFGWLAFYQTKASGEESYAINYYAPVLKVEVVQRHDLLPDESHHPRASEDYYKVQIGALHRLPRPIVSRRQRFIVFISTTLAKFQQAAEINDLFHESPLEDEVWQRFKQEAIDTERQWYLSIGRSTYCLDFAIFCVNGRVDVECDGDTWHSNPARIPEDNRRDNALTSAGWAVLRFNTKQVAEEWDTCVWRVRETANRYGGIVTAEGETRWLSTGDEAHKQLNLFSQPDKE